MSDAFDKISKVWTEFPFEYKNSILYDDVNELKTAFENKKDLFSDYITKIVIIGKVSTGKSAFINALLGKAYFASITGDGTVAFFYCSLSEKNHEYFTVNDCPIERKEIETLVNVSRLNNHLPDYFDQNSVIKVYVKQDISKILERKTVIVDCPGFGYDEIYELEIEKHCSNADMFIFMFQIGEPATIKQRNIIRKIKNKAKKPTCFFVYNKCDLPEFNERMKITLRNDINELFEQDCVLNHMLNENLIYFISAMFPDQCEDFYQLKQDIMNHKTNRFHEYLNNQSNLSKKIKGFLGKLSYFISQEKDKMSSLKRFNEKRDQILSFVKRHIENCQNNLLLDEIFELILKEIFENKEKCDKKTASIMISQIEQNIKNLVNEFVENHLQKSCIDPINKKLHDIKNDTNGSIIINDIGLEKSRQHLITPTFRKINDMFSFFEFGDKTKEVKQSFEKFIQSETSKTLIINSIKNLYNSEFSNIQVNIEDILDNLSSENKNMEKKLESLLYYERSVNENEKRYNESCL